MFSVSCTELLLLPLSRWNILQAHLSLFYHFEIRQDKKLGVTDETTLGFAAMGLLPTSSAFPICSSLATSETGLRIPKSSPVSSASVCPLMQGPRS